MTIFQQGEVEVFNSKGGPEFFLEGKGGPNFFARFERGAKFFSRVLRGGAEKIDNRRSWIDAPLPVKNDSSLNMSDCLRLSII